MNCSGVVYCEVHYNETSYPDLRVRGTSAQIVDIVVCPGKDGGKSAWQLFWKKKATFKNDMDHDMCMLPHLSHLLTCK